LLHFLLPLPGSISAPSACDGRCQLLLLRAVRDVWYLTDGGPVALLFRLLFRLLFSKALSLKTRRSSVQVKGRLPTRRAVLASRTYQKVHMLPKGWEKE